MPFRALRQNRSAEEVIQIALRLGLLAALILWCFVIVRPFIGILAWSVVLAVALYPLFAWLSEHLGRSPKLAACIVTVLAAAIVIVPATWLGIGLA
jgi:predicted PurR-regulated permease PerM